MVKKLKNMIKMMYAVLISVLLLISMLTLMPNSMIHSASAQSTSGSSISSNLINDIFASPAGNDSRSFAGIGTGVTTPNLLWTAHIPGVNVPTISGMTAFGGYVFVQNATDTLALDGGTGNIVYAIPNTTGAPMYLGGNYMFLGGNCYAVDTGTLVWKSPAGFTDAGFIGYGQAIWSGGGALVTDPQYLPAPMFFNNGCGWELNNPAQPPTVLWNDTTNAQVPSGTGSAYDNGVMVYTSAEQTFSGFNASTGAYLWTVPCTSPQLWGCTAIDGVFAFGAQDGVMYCWNITTGQLMWTFDPGTLDSTWSWSLGSSYGMIYGHNQDTHFYAVNATNGKLVWNEYSPGNGVSYSGTFSIAGGYIYTEMGDNEYRDPNTGQYGHSEFDCYNAYNGTLVWSIPYENGAPQDAQCNAYGNLYLIPTSSSSTSGGYTYSTSTSATGGFNTQSDVVCLGNGPAQSWSMYLNDPTHNSEGWGPTNLTELWSKPLGNGAPFASSPVFANDIGYIGSTDHNIYAFNASNGNVIWNFTTKAGVHSTPAVINGYVYTGADDGNVYCLNAATGALAWSVSLLSMPAINLGFGEIGTDGPPSPMVVGNNLYVGANNYIFCLNANTGATIWKYTWGSALLIGSPTIVNNIVYVAPNQAGPNGYIYELNAQTGALMQNMSFPYVVNPFIAAGNPSARITGQGIEAPVTVDTLDNIIFVQQINMRTFAINGTSGKILWTYDAYYDPLTTGQWGTDNVGGILFAGGNCYFNEWYAIVCVNALSGNASWTTYLSREDDAPLSYYAGNIYAVTYLNYAYVLNGATGAKESYAFCGDEATQPVPYAGNLYVASGDFNVTCFTQATAASSVTPIPTPTPTPTPTPAPTSPPVTATPLQANAILTPLYIMLSVLAVAMIVAIAIVGALITRNIKKRP